MKKSLIGLNAGKIPVLSLGDKNNDGIINLAPGKVLTAKKPVFAETEDGEFARGEHGQRLVSNANFRMIIPMSSMLTVISWSWQIQKLPNCLTGLSVWWLLVVLPRRCQQQQACSW